MKENGKIRHLTESEAWKYLARRWDTVKPQNRPVLIITEQLGSNYGICTSLPDLVATRMISGYTFRRMKSRMYRAKPELYGGGDGYWWPRSMRGAKQRAAFCRYMADLAGME